MPFVVPGAPPGSLTVAEADGSPSGSASVLVLPNTTLALSGGTATYTPVATSGIIVQEEGSTVGTATVINFVGSNITATFSGGTATLTDSGGGGGGAGNGMIAFHPLWADPVASTGTWTSILFSDVGTPLVNAPAYYNSSSAQNDAVSWDMWLDAGTYTFSAWVRKTSNTAIITLNQDGASQGTVDTYAAAPALALVSITGWTVASTGKHTMQVKAATKNASSSGYLLEFFGVVFRRTA